MYQLLFHEILDNISVCSHMAKDEQCHFPVHVLLYCTLRGWYITGRTLASLSFSTTYQRCIGIIRPGKKCSSLQLPSTVFCLRFQEATKSHTLTGCSYSTSSSVLPYTDSTSTIVECTVLVRNPSLAKLHVLE